MRPTLSPQPESPLHLKSQDIPQANSLERILAFLEDVGHRRAPAAVTPGISGYQRAYYQRATEILGLIDDRGELREAGRATLALPSDARMARLSLAFQNSACG